MYEVELKVPADHAAVRDRLAERGVAVGPTVAQADTYYDAPHRDFATTDEALRVRLEGVVETDGPVTDVGATVEAAVDDSRATLTYKGPLVDDETKTREEVETPVGDGGATAAILEQLGFEPAATVRKCRATASVEGYHVTLDRVAGLGDYLEVETTATAADLDAARDGARDVLAGLGLETADTVRTSYLGLLLADNPEE